MYQIIYTKSYLKKAKQFIKQHPALLKQYQKTLQLLEINPHHPSLRLHQLSGKFDKVHSISINMSYRITLELVISDKKITLLNIGNHNLVYR